MILLKSKQYMLVGLTAVALTLTACGGDSAKNGTTTPVVVDPAPSVTDKDTDGDGVLDSKDNCPTVSNADQADTDKDGVGDFCDNDIDGDGINNAADECPFDPDINLTQADCLAPDADFDKDGIKNSVDNCPIIPNVDQGDRFNKVAQNNTPDGIGDACQNSDDLGNGTGDQFFDNVDNCPLIGNPNQEDSDKLSDMEPGVAPTNKGGDACDNDDDNDGVLDFATDGAVLDNCRLKPNPGQEPGLNGGGAPGFTGAACADDPQADMDGDGFNNQIDTCPTIKNPGNNPDFCLDPDGDGINNNRDNCDAVANFDQINTDGDALGDACDADDDADGIPDADDTCPIVSNPNNDPAACSDNFDGDKLKNDFDNCPNIVNDDQADFDGDAIGDACDSDNDNDGFFDKLPEGSNQVQQMPIDNCPYIANSAKKADGTQSSNPCELEANIGNLQCDSYTVATVEPIVEGALCQILGALNNPLGLCGVNNATAAADGSDQSFATINNAVVLPDSLAGNLLTGEVGVRVKLPAERKKGSIAAMEIEIPGGTVDLTLFRNIKLVTKLKGVEQERRETLGEFTTNPGNAFSLDVLGFSPIGSSARALLGFVSTKDFDSIELTVTAGLSVDLLEQLRVYDTCSAASVKPGTTTGSTTPPSTNPLAGTPLEGLGDVGSMIPGLGGGAFPPELPGAGSGEDPFAIFTDPEGPFAPLVALFSDPVGAFTTFAEMFTGFFSNPGAAFSGLTEMFSPAS